jgi:hypothetical protein
VAFRPSTATPAAHRLGPTIPFLEDAPASPRARTHLGCTPAAPVVAHGCGCWPRLLGALCIGGGSSRACFSMSVVQVVRARRKGRTLCWRGGRAGERWLGGGRGPSGVGGNLAGAGRNHRHQPPPPHRPRMACPPLMALPPGGSRPAKTTTMLWDRGSGTEGPRTGPRRGPGCERPRDFMGFEGTPWDCPTKVMGLSTSTPAPLASRASSLLALLAHASLHLDRPKTLQDPAQNPATPCSPCWLPGQARRASGGGTSTATPSAPRLTMSARPPRPSPG